jgi:DNA-binding NarL/FixJ family response regulator
LATGGIIVSQGKIIIAPQVAAKLADRLFQIDCGDPFKFYSDSDSPKWLNLLTTREKKILWLMANGYNNKEIAVRLYFAEQTVKNYVSLIYDKLGVHDRVQVSLLARKAGLE